MAKKLKTIDNIALKYIKAQASLNEMIRVNIEQANRIDSLIAMNKAMREYKGIKAILKNSL